MTRLLYLAAKFIMPSLTLAASGSIHAETRYRITDLGELPGGDDERWARDVNDAAQVAGRSIDADTGRALASHLLLHGGMDINEKGQIVGQMSIDGVRHAYLLTLLPGSSALCWWIILLLVILLLLL